MFNKLQALMITLVALWGCHARQGDEKAAIARVMEAQVVAWNQGNLEEYMQGYWQSDSLIFTGRKDVTYGWQDALARYRKAYADKEAMGQLAFSGVRTELIGTTGAFTVGQWKLDRVSDTLSGRFTLIWSKLKTGQWVIVADHSS